MNWLEQFIVWFRNLGGTVPLNFKEAINDRYVYDPPKVSTLKGKADYVKTVYNHKFVKKSPVDGHPDINKIRFHKK